MVEARDDGCAPGGLGREGCGEVALGVRCGVFGPKDCIMQQLRSLRKGWGGQFICEKGHKYFAKVIEINLQRA